ncbi:MAG: CCA tRNA nucleotidyltransferase [Chthoniobacterales bacterium]|nr:CCA tRNA nucleotidyltransferase [Chthoniobacterales bacterium]
MEATAIRIVRRLRDAGHEAYFAGGCVRDRLLGCPAYDMDVATSAPPETVQKLFPKTVAVGAQFGVIVVLEGGWEFQVATFRADGVYLDGRRPEGVTFTTAEGDARRRDFTINGLFFDPLEGKILDFVGGEADLKAGVIRCIGEPSERFGEDKLRLIRGVRFAAKLGFRIDPPTWAALRNLAHTIPGVSAERIRDELMKIFLHPTRVRGFDLLDESGLLEILLPEVTGLKGCEQPPEFHPEGDVFVHTRLMVSLLPEEVSIPLVFAVLFHDIGKPSVAHTDATGRIRFNGHETASALLAEKILARLRFSNAQTGEILASVKNHMAFKDVQNMRVATLKRFLARPTIADELELHRVDCLASHGLLDNYEFLLAKREEFSREPLIPPPLLTGRDLIALGWTPGPLFKKVLDAAQVRQLEGMLTSREEALEWVASHGIFLEKGGIP